jgi:hypothetical protein
MEAIRKEIEKIEQSAERIKVLGEDNPSLRGTQRSCLTLSIF